MLLDLLDRKRGLRTTELEESEKEKIYQKHSEGTQQLVILIDDISGRLALL